MGRIIKRFIFWLVFSFPFICYSQHTDNLSKDEKAAFGRLDNGLHYILQPTVGVRTEYRLVLNVGSLQEREDERAYAHFLEHAVFNHAIDFPNRKIIDTLSNLGYQFGRDINAYTTYDRTVFSLSILDSSLEKLSLNILLNILSKAVFRDEDIEKEKNIVFQEIKDYKQQIFSEQKLLASSYENRLPIGQIKDVELIEIPKLISFYRNWYRPDLATLIITGKLDTAQTILNINKTFGKVFTPNRTVQRQQNYYSFNPVSDGKLYKNKDSSLKVNKLEIIRFTESGLMKTKQDFRRHLVEDLYKKYLVSKLRQANTMIQYESIWYLPHQNENALTIKSMSEDEQINRLQSAASVIGAINRQGIAVDDLEIIKKDFLKHYPSNAYPIEAKNLADAYVDEVAVGHNYLSKTHKDSLTLHFLSQINQEDINREHNKIWFLNKKNVSYFFEYNSALFDINASVLDSIWNTALNSPLLLSNLTEKKENHTSKLIFNWNELPKVKHDGNGLSAILEESFYAGIGVTEFVLKNGIRLAVKPIPNVKETIFSFTVKAGLNQLLESEYPYYQDASYFIGESKISGLSTDIYNSMLIERGLSILTYMSEDATTLNAVSLEGNLEDLYELTFRKLYAYSMPVEDFETYRKEQIQQLGREQLSSPFDQYSSMRLKKRISFYQSGDPSFEYRLKTKEDWAKVNLNNMFRLFDLSARNLDSAYILISGNVNIEEARNNFVDYFSHLKADSLSIAKGVFRKSQTVSIQNNNPELADSTRVEAAIVFLCQMNGTLKDNVILNIINSLINAEFLSFSREQEGLSYSPYTNLNMMGSKKPKASITIGFSTEKRNLERMEKYSIELIKRICNNTISKAKLKSLKNTIVNNKKSHLAMATPQMWVEQLRTYYLRYGTISSLEKYEVLLNSITASDIQLAAKRLLSEKNYKLFYEPYD
ncbi:M16 family metallopeptidase [Sphingobacterium humi]|nr:insulinase family protein [Sphingobacterium humi]